MVFLEITFVPVVATVINIPPTCIAEVVEIEVNAIARMVLPDTVAPAVVELIEIPSNALLAAVLVPTL